MNELFRLFQQVELALGDDSPGRLHFRSSRLLQRAALPHPASIYAVTTDKHAICYAIGPPVDGNECVTGLVGGISLNFGRRSPNCPDAFVIDGLASDNVARVRLAYGSSYLDVPVRGNSFLEVIPPAVSAHDVRSITVFYRKGRPRRFAVQL